MVNLVSVREAAQILGVSQQRVYQWVDAGSLPALRVGHNYVLRRDVVELFSKRERKVGRPKGAKGRPKLVA